MFYPFLNYDGLNLTALAIYQSRSLSVHVTQLASPTHKFMKLRQSIYSIK